MSTRNSLCGVVEVTTCLGFLAESLLGPNSSLKCVINDTEVRYVRDVSLLLQLLDIEHPAGQYVCLVCQGFTQRYKTGAATLLVFISKLMKAARSLQDQGIAEHDAILCLQEALEGCIAETESLKISINDLFTSETYFCQGDSCNRQPRSSSGVSSSDLETEVVTEDKSKSCSKRGRTWDERADTMNLNLKEVTRSAQQIVQDDINCVEEEEDGFKTIEMKVIHTTTTTDTDVSEADKDNIPMIQLKMEGRSHINDEEGDEDVSWFFEDLSGLDLMGIDNHGNLIDPVTSPDVKPLNIPELKIDSNFYAKHNQTNSQDSGAACLKSTATEERADSDHESDDCFINQDDKIHKSWKTEHFPQNQQNTSGNLGSVDMESDGEFESCFEDVVCLQESHIKPENEDISASPADRATELKQIEQLLAGIKSKQSVDQRKLENNSRHFKTFQLSIHQDSRGHEKYENTQSPSDIKGEGETRENEHQEKSHDIKKISSLLENLKTNSSVGLNQMLNSSRHFKTIESSVSKVIEDSDISSGTSDKVDILRKTVMHANRRYIASKSSEDGDIPCSYALDTRPGNSSHLSDDTDTVGKDHLKKVSSNSDVHGGNTSSSLMNDSTRKSETQKQYLHVKSDSVVMGRERSDDLISRSTESQTGSSNRVVSRSDVGHIIRGLCHGAPEDIVNIITDLVVLQTSCQSDGKLYLDSKGVYCVGVASGLGGGARLIEGLVLDASSAQLMAVTDLKGRAVPTLFLNGNLTPSFRHKGYKKQEGVTMVTTAQTYLQGNHVTKMDQWLLDVHTIIKELKVRALLVKGDICEEVLDLCQSCGVVAIGNIPYKVLEVLSVATATNLATYITDSTDVNVCSNIYLSPWRSDWMDKGQGQQNVILSVPHCKIHTVILRACTAILADLREQEFWDCLHRVTSAVRSGILVPGGLTIEQRCSRVCWETADSLRKRGTVSNLRQQQLITAYESLETVFRDYVTLVSSGNHYPSTEDPLVSALLCNSHSDVVKDNELNSFEALGSGTHNSVHLNGRQNWSSEMMAAETCTGHHSIYEDLSQCEPPNYSISHNSPDGVCILYDDHVTKMAAWRTAMDTVAVLLLSDYYITTGITNDHSVAYKHNVIL